MNYVKIVLLGIQILSAVIRYLDEKRLLNEGAKLEIERELARVAKIVARAEKIHTKVDKMTDAQVDDALSGDFRP